MDITRINVNGQYYNIIDTVTSINGKTGAIGASDIASVLTTGGYVLSSTNIEQLIPSQASSSNQLADKSFVNSSIATSTATYRGDYNLVTDLSLTTQATTSQIATALASTISTADNNDYCYVKIPTSDAISTEIDHVDRYKYNGTSWSYEYELNNSGFTAAQWAAIQSGISSTLVTKLSALPTNTELNTALGNKADKSEMSITAGTGNDADKTTIQLKSGLSTTVLTQHQTLEGYYSAFHSGLADNLFGETQTTDIFTFRPTAGIQDIESGDAPVGGGTIKKVEGNGVSFNQLYDSAVPTTITDHKYLCSELNGTTRKKEIVTAANVANWFTADSTERNVIDLTLLGIDNLTTKEEVEAWLANNVGLKDYYPYNEGELIPVKDFKVKSVGFNMLDVSTMLKSTDYGDVSILGNTVTLTRHGSNQCFFVGVENTNIEKLPVGSSVHFSCNVVSKTETSRVPDITIFYKDGTFTRIQNGQSGVITKEVGNVLLYYASGEYSATVVLSDICINLSYEGDRNGEYEEYWEREVGVDVTKVYGKLNGTGESVQVFPDGLKKAGSVKDEIVRSGDVVKAIKRIGVVDLGTFNLGKNDAAYYFYFPNRKPSSVNMLCEQYSVSNTTEGYAEVKNMELAQLAGTGNEEYIVIRNDSYSDSESMKSALSGVNMYYELATPEEYILDENIMPVQYRVDNYGTEEVLLGNDEGLVSCSPKMTIRYGINAADTIADLPHSYISNLPQQLDEDKQKQARQNINAASQDSIIRIQEQLDAINPKVDNDVYVDMGLPSGLLWAKRNIDVTQPDGFAASPFQYECSFFSWGNVDVHNPISESAFDYDFGTSNDGVYASTSGAAISYPSSAGLSYDIARKTLGAPWRLPSSDDFQELFDNCKFVQADGETEIDASQTNKLVTVNGIVGIYLKSKINSRLLFFACSGYGYGQSWNRRGSNGNYWSSSLGSADDGRHLDFGSGGVDPQDNHSRFLGFAVRPVM